jgi:hypothetical protein
MTNGMTSQGILKYLPWVLVISLLTSCSAAETPNVSSLSPTSQPTTDSSDLEKAQTSLIAFFSYLSEGKYSQAVELYGGSEDQYEALRSNNPTVDPEDKAALLEAGCTYQYRCLQIKDVVQADQVSQTEFNFIVQFENPDGSLFMLGPCCGADETEMPPQSEFKYGVIKMDDHFLVVGELLYVP